MSPRRKVTPTQAMSARQVDRLERELSACLKLLSRYPLAWRLEIVRVLRRLRALRDSVRKAERR